MNLEIDKKELLDLVKENPDHGTPLKDSLNLEKIVDDMMDELDFNNKQEGKCKEK